MTILRKRVIPRDAQDADEMMPSILFPPLLSLDASETADEEADISSPSKGGGISCNNQGASCQINQVHDYPRRPSSRRPMKESFSGMHHSQSMPSFEYITLKMSEKNNMDDYIAAAPEITASYDTKNNIDDGAPAAAAAAEGGLALPFPTYIPKLRIRRIASDLDLKIMPSPLARRGGKEMEYLQKQLKAEALIRRKQQQHNEERNRRRREARQNDDNNSSEDEDTFAYAPNNCNCRRGRTNNTVMDLAGSPPAILKRYALRRTVSETLQDSGIPEDANLLFPPMGKPLIDDADVVNVKNHEDHEHAIYGKEGESSSDTEDVFVMDEDASLCSRSQVGFRRVSKDESAFTEEGGWCGGSTVHSTDDDDEDDVELSPSLMPAGMQYQVGDSSVDDMKSDSSPPNAYKKITLLPKMKVRADSCDFPPPLTHMYKSSDLEVSTNEQILKDDKAEKVDPPSVGKGRYASPQKSRFGRLAGQRFMMAASESFDGLSLEDRVAINNDAMCNRTRVNTADSDTFDRLGASPSFSESNYATPDSSFSNRRSVRACTLFSKNQGPELPLTTSPFPEQNYHTPGSSQSRRHRERMGVPSQLPLAPFLEEENGVMQSEVTPEPNFATPQNILDRKVNRSTNLLSIPQFAELVVPQLGRPTLVHGPTKPHEVGAASSSEEKKESDAEDLKSPL
mmetsp:Transcript_24811/g.38014  ORF Transcript_24811/g.38014 Transcript_24811/m.38014 type:complete len:681 (+) Transcript_24811:564-2606(+)